MEAREADSLLMAEVSPMTAITRSAPAATALALAMASAVSASVGGGGSFFPEIVSNKPGKTRVGLGPEN